MSSIYQSQAATALRILGAKGQTMTLRRFDLSAAYNPLLPEAASFTVLDECEAKGVVLPASNGTIEAFDDRILKNPSLRQSFRFVILAGLGLTFTPQAEDVLVTNEGTYRLLGATPLNPDGLQALLWNVGCTLDNSIVIPEGLDFAALLDETGAFYFTMEDGTPLALD